MLFEARFVIDERAAVPAPPRASADDEPLRRKIAELQATLLERNAEIVRVSALYKDLQIQRSTPDTGSTTSDRVNAAMAREIDELRGELEHERTEHAARRDAAERLQQRVTQLEAQLAAQERKLRSELNDGNLRCKELESKLRMATSDLALAREALAMANDNLRTVTQAYEDARTRLELARDVSGGSQQRSG